MLTAEPESMKQNQNVQPVEEQTQSTARPFDVEEIRKKIPKAFRGYLDPVISWANSVEARLLEIQKEMPAQIQASMEQAIESQRQKQAAMYKQSMSQGGQPQQGGGIPGAEQIIGGIFQQAMGGGGGGYDEEMNKLTKEIMRANLDRIKQDASFTDAIKTAIVTKIAGKAASTLADGIV